MNCEFVRLPAASWERFVNRFEANKGMLNYMGAIIRMHETESQKLRDEVKNLEARIRFMTDAKLAKEEYEMTRLRSGVWI